MSLSPSTTTTRSSPAIATVTGLAALTTPFVQPPGCESHWTLTTVPIIIRQLDGSTVSASTSISSVLVSQHVASCHPSGWDRIVPPLQEPLHFRPGVCPSAWTYYSMSAPSSHPISTTAFCCNSGFVFNIADLNFLSTFGKYQCTRTAISGDQLLAVAKVSPTTMDRPMIIVHEAWAVTWEAADRSTLTPKLPELSGAMFFPTWTPGEGIPKDAYDPDHMKTDSRSDEEYFGRTFWYFLVVGIPIISILLISSCVCCCVSNSRSNRRKKAAARDSIVQPNSVNRNTT